MIVRPGSTARTYSRRRIARRGLGSCGDTLFDGTLDTSGCGVDPMPTGALPTTDTIKESIAATPSEISGASFFSTYKWPIIATAGVAVLLAMRGH